RTIRKKSSIRSPRSSQVACWRRGWAARRPAAAMASQPAAANVNRGLNTKEVTSFFMNTTRRSGACAAVYRIGCAGTERRFVANKICDQLGYLIRRCVAVKRNSGEYSLPCTIRIGGIEAAFQSANHSSLYWGRADRVDADTVWCAFKRGGLH